jgi:SAM-dependent methyltransferase
MIRQLKTIKRLVKRLGRSAHDWVWPKIDSLYDFRHGTETGGRFLADKLDLSSQDKSRTTGYEATSPYLFTTIMKQLPISHEEFVFIDIGSGKGRVLFLASRYPFRRIIGVEFSEKLHATAEDNLARYLSRHQKCTEIDLVYADVSEYALPDINMVLYLFNPFDQITMNKVMENVRKIAADAKRKIYLIYCNNKHSSIIEKSGLFPDVKKVKIPYLIRNIDGVLIYSNQP